MSRPEYGNANENREAFFSAFQSYVEMQKDTRRMLRKLENESCKERLIPFHLDVCKVQGRIGSNDGR